MADPRPYPSADDWMLPPQEAGPGLPFTDRFSPVLPNMARTYRAAGMPYQDQYAFNDNPDETWRAYDKFARDRETVKNLESQPDVTGKPVGPAWLYRTPSGKEGPTLGQQIETDKQLAGFFGPTSLAEVPLIAMGGPAGRAVGKLGAIGLGATGFYGMGLDEAQAVPLGKAVRGVARGVRGGAEDVARGAENWRLGGVADPTVYSPPPAGHNLPPTGSLNPLANETVTFRGKEPKDFTPEEWQAFGQHYQTDKPLGPLSPLQTFKDVRGNEFQIPGGLGGEWTYYDLLHMKANPINPANVDRQLHAEMQRKLGRTMTPTAPSDEQTWNGLVFGMTSPNNPLFPNQMTASRMRMRTPEMIDDLANSIPWKPGEEVSAETRKTVSDAIAAKYQLHKGSEGGLGSRGTADYSRIGEMAQMFRDNPHFFRKQPNESWGQAVERISSQLPGLSMKTGSFGTVWQDPAHAAIAAIDRHMARELEKTGKLFADPAERTAWENRSVNLWNKREAKRVADQTKENVKKGSTREVAAADAAADWDDLMKKSGSDGFIGEMLLDHVGDAKTPVFRKASGQVNPDIPTHLAKANWVREPESVFKMGAAYKRALDLNQQIAKENGLDLFMSQWMEWDRIRNRFEPHENMFPGLSRTPALSVGQMKGADLAHRETGHKTYGKDPEGSLLPTRPLSGLPSRMGYLGIGGIAAGAATLPSNEAEAGPLGKVVRGAVPIRAYHSSPHDFDRFDMSKIGTGEGAQVYGHGLYFAENPKVSGQGGEYWQQFKNRFAYNPAEMEAVNMLQNHNFDRKKAIAELTDLKRYQPGYVEGAINAADRAKREAINAKNNEALALLESGKLIGPRTYEVNINARPEQMLDWDKPLREQSQLQRDAARKFGMLRDEYTGSEVYKTVAMNKRPEGATSAFAEAGIPGIRYLDEGSRGRQHSNKSALFQEPLTSNYVIFDPGIIEIAKKYGIPGMLGAGALGETVRRDKYGEPRT